MKIADSALKKLSDCFYFDVAGLFAWKRPAACAHETDCTGGLFSASFSMTPPLHFSFCRHDPFSAWPFISAFILKSFPRYLDTVMGTADSSYLLWITAASVSPRQLLCCRWNNEVFLLNVVMKRLSRCFDVTAVPGAARLCAAFTITVANGEMNLFRFHFLFFELGFACFDSGNSVLFLVLFSICEVWPSLQKVHMSAYFFLLEIHLFVPNIYKNSTKKAKMPSSFIVS